MAEPLLLEERADGIARLTLNRGQARNALSRGLRSAIAAAFAAVARDEDVGVVILTGSDPAFCAGLDLKELGGEAGESGGAAGATRSGGDMIAAIEACPKPVIGAINGVAITGGFELALACDLLVASDRARFADTHARVGILPGWGLSQKLPRLIGVQRAKELAFTGNFVEAERAARIGLVNRVVPHAELLPVCESLARDMLSCVPEALRGYKALIDAGVERSYGAARELERERSAAHARLVPADAIRSRRDAIQARGRAQQ